MRKGIRLGQIEDAVRWTKEIGIETLASFIIGWPNETMDDIKNTLNFAKRLDTDYVQFSFATPYPGTELYRLVKKERLLLTENWSEYTAGRPIIRAGECSAEELARALLQAYMSFYLSPSFLLRNLRKGRVPLLLRAALLTFRSKNRDENQIEPVFHDR
jgi:radical SAM superfamily enzyme YgiQ (UPF0313 family)